MARQVTRPMAWLLTVVLAGFGLALGTGLLQGELVKWCQYTVTKATYLMIPKDPDLRGDPLYKDNWQPYPSLVGSTFCLPCPAPPPGSTTQPPCPAKHTLNVGWFEAGEFYFRFKLEGASPAACVAPCVSTYFVKLTKEGYKTSKGPQAPGRGGQREMEVGVGGGRAER